MQYQWTLESPEEPSALKERTCLILGGIKEYFCLDIFNFSAYFFLDSSSEDILFSGIPLVDISVSSGDVGILLCAFSALSMDCVTCDSLHLATEYVFCPKITKHY